MKKRGPYPRYSRNSPPSRTRLCTTAPALPPFACKFFFSVSSGKVHRSVKVDAAPPTRKSRSVPCFTCCASAARYIPLRTVSQIPMPPAERAMAGPKPL